MSECTCLRHSDVSHNTIADYFAKDVAQDFYNDEDSFEMKNADRINSSGIVDLTHSKKISILSLIEKQPVKLIIMLEFVLRVVTD